MIARAARIAPFGARALARAVTLLLVAVAPLAGPAAARAAPRTGDERAAGGPGDARGHRAPAFARHADVEPIAIVGATVHRVTRPSVDATLLLAGGRIAGLVPPGTRLRGRWRVIDATGRHVYPGLVAASAADLGLAPDASAGGADAVLARGLAESFDAWSRDVELAASAGITSAFVHRTALDAKGPFAGRGAMLKMSCGEPRGVLLKDPAGVRTSRALLSPGGAHALARLLEQARSSKRARSRSGGGSAAGSGAARAAVPDVVREVARGRIPLVASGAGAGHLLVLADLARRHDLRLVVQGSADDWTAASELADAGAAVVHGVRHSWGKPREDRRVARGGGWRADAADVLADAGVPVAIAPVSDVIELWGVAGRDLLHLPMEAAFAQRGGLSADEALAAITIVPARIFGVDDRVGSIEPGKDADVIITDGDLLDYRTLVRTTIVNGRVAFEAEGDATWGGVVARRDRSLRDGSSQAPAAAGTP